ncbi:hypothetical protein LSH36_117g02009 [Paralvinella palmiformis]|uniref:Uncharacterized protein n=1 Tax=Paralvinella palmiformis TaxID=53620 RepID=A0AAD9NAF0_9ANNE|nr:hypothetical protein LSH36_117g02009 [Paralvinella palmiformis]
MILKSSLARFVLFSIFISCFGLIMISLTIQTGQTYRRHRHIDILQRRRNQRSQLSYDFDDDRDNDIVVVDWSSLVRPINDLSDNSPPSISLSDEDLPDVTRRRLGSPLLTLFTTVDDDSANPAYTNTIHNWAALRRYAMPVLFVTKRTSENLVRSALALGWKTTAIERLKNGTPILKYMFLEAIERHQSLFYGYADARILFDGTLVRNFRAFSSYLKTTRNLFVIGKSLKLNISDFAFHQGNVSNLTTLKVPGEKNRSFLSTIQKDYFITTRSGFPWRQIPDLVVSGIGYDGWLVAKAQDWNLTVVDASYTILSVHQIGSEQSSSLPFIEYKDSVATGSGSEQSGVRCKLVY